MRKRLTKAEKWLFASPLLLLVVAGVFWMRQKNGAYSLALPQALEVPSIEFSPDGQMLVLVAENEDRGQRLVRIFDLESRGVVCDLPLPSSPIADTAIVKPVWSPDGKCIASVVVTSLPNQIGKEIVIWDVLFGTIKTKFSHPAMTSGDIHFSANGKTLVESGVPPTILDAATGQRLNKSNKKVNLELEPIFSEKSGLYATRKMDDYTIRVIELKSGRAVWEPDLEYVEEYKWGGDVLGLEVLESSRHSQDRELKFVLWDGKIRQQLPSPPVDNSAFVTAFDFNPHDSTVAYTQLSLSEIPKAKTGEDSVRREAELIVWDYRANRVRWRTFVQNEESTLKWSPDGKHLVSIGRATHLPTRLIVFDQNGNREIERAPVATVATWSGDSQQLAIVATETDESGELLKSRPEVHRFED